MNQPDLTHLLRIARIKIPLNLFCENRSKMINLGLPQLSPPLYPKTLPFLGASPPIFDIREIGSASRYGDRVATPTQSFNF